MREQKEAFYSLQASANLGKDFLLYMQKKMFFFLLAILLGTGAGAAYYFIQKPKYEAISTFILEEKTPGGGGLAGLASQFGFDLSALGGGGSIFTGDNILDILRSKKILFKVLLTKVGSDTASNSNTLADSFLDFSGWREDWAGKEHLKNISFASVRFGQTLSPKQDSVLSIIHEHLLKKSIGVDRVNKKGSIIKVSVKAANSIFARLLTERMVDEAAKLYLDIKTGTAQANIALMQRRADSLLFLLNRKSYVAAANQMVDLNPGLKTATVPLEIASRDKTVLATLYAEVTKNLEASKLLLSQQMPVIQLLDQPSVLLDDNKKSLVLLLAVSAILTGLIFFVVTLLFFIVKKVR